ncbi:MAG TPA: menaquinone biosynthesis decarboxylase, partial [Campylobacterales bacterium]|nr:menaquinone biosynthesis decarboxylase [Campylobacterales bacterium]
MNKYNNKTIEILERNNLLRVIHEPLDIYLEIPHVAYIETKKEKSKALLFTNVVDKKKNKKFDTPVLMNVFCNEKAIELFIGNLKEIENEISSLLKMEPAEGFSNKIKMFGKLFNLKYAFPKKLKKRGVCQEVIHLGQEAKTSNIPVLTTWEQDAGAFITMGQVYTKSLNGKMSNVGMYRL